MKHSQRKYSDEFKLQVVEEYLEGSLGCRLLARKYNLPSKNYILSWKEQLIQKGLLKDNAKKVYLNNSNTKNKTAYEKQLERENLELRAELAFYQEMKRLIDDEKDKKNSYHEFKKFIPCFFTM